MTVRIAVPGHIKYQAKYYTPAPTPPRDINLIVFHDMESPEKPDTAEHVAAWFSGPTAPRSSVHACVDNNSIVRTLADKHIGWHAGVWDVNVHSLGIEHAGYANQTSQQWLDDYGKAMLEQSAAMVAAWCHRYDIPVQFVDAAGLKAGKRGITTHREVTHAYPVEAAKSGSHSDPGPNFPMSYYIERVKAHMPKAKP